MSERIQRQGSRRENRRADEAVEAAPQRRAVDYDALLDEIDVVLASDAADYVKNFVQKGGQ